MWPPAGITGAMTTPSRRTFITSTITTSAAALLLRGHPLRAAPAAGELRDDVAIVRRAMNLHPGVFRYQSTADLAQSLDRLERDFVAAPDLDQRYLVLSAFLAGLRCGHSHCNPYNQSRAVATALFDRPTRLPFEFTWIGARMIVLADRSGSGRLPRGTEIRTIDGMPAAHLLHRLLAYARADGHNDAKRVAQLDMRNVDRFETFDIFQGLLAPPRDGRFIIAWRTPDGQLHRGEFVPQTRAQRMAGRHTIETDGTAAPFWTWTMQHGIATLTMPSWVMFNSTWDWQTWLNDRLSSLTGARGLILDLRDNEGGNDCGNAILARLAGHDLEFAHDRQLVRYRRTPADFDRYLDTWDNSFRTIGDGATDVGGGFYQLSRNEAETIAAVAPRVTLPVAACVGPTCSSATFAFALRARQSGLVRLFGQPTGGNLRGINGGCFFFVRLPGSGLEFDLPIIGNFPTGPLPPDRGVLPDVMVAPTIADIAAGRDPCMGAAMGWLRSARREVSKMQRN